MAGTIEGVSSNRRPVAPARSGSARAEGTGSSAAPRTTTASRVAPPESRAGSRPATRGSRSAATPPRGTPRAERVQQRVPRLLTVRAMVLGIVCLVAFVLVYPTLHSYLGERAEVDRLRADVAAAQARNDDLNADLARWDDPAYVAAQARERLSFVLPGEKAFRVVDPETVQDDGTVVAADPPTGAGEIGSLQPWYLTVWDSVQSAGDDAPTAGTTAPAAPLAEVPPADTATTAP